jgi:hypothetical protein
VLAIGRRPIIDQSRLPITLTTTGLLWKFKKLQELPRIAITVLLGLLIYRLHHG